MTINELVHAGPVTVTELVQNFRDGKYYVDNSFQRRLVWTEKQKIRLIETILIGYPIPEIYLHQQPPDIETHQIRHSIVDGQQRINCLVQFISNEFVLGARHLDAENQDSDFANLDWTALSAERKNKILSYSLNARRVPQTVTLDEIRMVFKRLNETDRSLNPQEIRHAEFDGEFIKVAEEIANWPFWRKFDVFTDTNIRRMADVEFATSLLSLIKNGISSDTTASINELYDLFNDSYDDAEADKNEISSRLTAIETILDNQPELKSFFSKTVHLYTLFDLIPTIAGSDAHEDAIAKLCLFVEGYEGGIESQVFARYRSGAIQRTRSKLSRELRRDALREFVLRSQDAV